MHLRRRKKKVVEQLNALCILLNSQNVLQQNNAVKQQVIQPQQPIDNKPAPQDIQAKANMTIADMLGQVRKEQSQEIEQKSIKTQQFVVKPTGDINQEQLEIAWSKYANSIAQTNAYFSALMSVKPQAQGAVVVVKVASSLIADNFQGAKDLVEYLRQELNNETIIIKAEIDKSAFVNNEDIVYTSEQKLKKMIEGNPLIQNFLDEFALDIDY